MSLSRRVARFGWRTRSLVLLALTAGDNTLRLAPALIVSDKEIGQACGIIEAALKATAP